MTLNGVTVVILHYFTKVGSFGADYVKAIEDGRIISTTKNIAQRI